LREKLNFSLGRERIPTQTRPQYGGTHTASLMAFISVLAWLIQGDTLHFSKSLDMPKK